jgi:hypothetical protein
MLKTGHGETLLESDRNPSCCLDLLEWPVFWWTFPGKEEEWDDERWQLNQMPAKLGRGVL